MKIDRAVISVMHLARSIDFYVNGMGLEVVSDSDRSDGLIGSALLANAEGVIILELVLPLEYAMSPSRPDNLSQLGLKYVSFVVDDIEAVVLRAECAGARVVRNIQAEDDAKRSALVLDVEGNGLELVELRGA